LNGKDWDRQIKCLRERVFGSELPSVSKIAEEKRDPFRVLVSTIISLRTKDEVTAPASRRLFALADTPETILKIPEKTISETIFPAGFYRTKARQILECAAIIQREHNGVVPNSKEALMALPGVGLKTANLTLNLGFGIDAICVDIHVHRISNRLGWVSEKTPDKTEGALSRILPKKYWIEINGLLVTYGQSVCTPVSPRCSTCPLADECPKIEVTRTR
jgi:endonuclease III